MEGAGGRGRAIFLGKSGKELLGGCDGIFVLLKIMGRMAGVKG